MTPQLEAAIDAIRSLSSSERQQLLQILVQSESSLGSQHGLREKGGVLVGTDQLRRDMLKPSGA
jgi:hypothetical protein